MNIISDTDELIIEHEYEITWLRNKATGEILIKDDFYGDPQCGLIDSDYKWAIIGGEHLTIWTPTKSKIIRHDNLKWVYDLRVKDSITVEILTDPWSEKSAIWEINIHTFEIKRIRGFKDYRDKEYSENIIW